MTTESIGPFAFAVKIHAGSYNDICDQYGSEQVALSVVGTLL